MMTSGEQGRTPPDAEHYLDLSGVEEDSPGPHFDVVLRGYDRRQVDEHVAGLRRMNAQLRAQLAVRERRRNGPGAAGGSALEGRISDTMPEAHRPPADDAGVGVGDADMVGAFNDRLRGILQAAEQEAQLVRSKAAESLLAEHAESRAALADLRAQRDAVVDELVRLRGRLDDIVSGPVRPSAVPPGPPRPGHPGPAGPWRGPGRPPGPPGPGPRPPGAYGAVAPTAPPAAAAAGADGGVGSSADDTVTVTATPEHDSAVAADTADTVQAVDPADGAGDAPVDTEADKGVTEGARPTSGATRAAPSAPERAADG